MLQKMNDSSIWLNCIQYKGGQGSTDKKSSTVYPISIMTQKAKIQSPSSKAQICRENNSIVLWWHFLSLGHLKTFSVNSGRVQQLKIFQERWIVHISIFVQYCRGVKDQRLVYFCFLDRMRMVKGRYCIVLSILYIS